MSSTTTSTTSFAAKLSQAVAGCQSDAGDNQKPENSLSFDFSCSLSPLAFTSPKETVRKEPKLSVADWMSMPLLEYRTQAASPPSSSSSSSCNGGTWSHFTAIEQLMDAAASNRLDALTRLIRSGEV